MGVTPIGYDAQTQTNLTFTKAENWLSGGKVRHQKSLFPAYMWAEYTQLHINFEPEISAIRKE